MNKHQATLASFQKQTTAFLKELEQSQNKKLEFLKKKLTILQEEESCIAKHQWDVIEAKKKRQLETIEKMKKEYQAKGLWTKKMLTGQKRKNNIDPQVLSLLKRSVKITKDVATLGERKFNDYSQRLLQRIEKCKKKIIHLESKESLVDVQLELIPLYKHVEQLSKANDTPWCLTHHPGQAQLLGLPPTKPLYHLLDSENRIYLNRTPCVVEFKPSQIDGYTGAAQPNSSAAQFMARMNSVRHKKTNQKNISVLAGAKQTVDSEAQVKHLKGILQVDADRPANWCPECKSVTEWSKDAKHGVMVCQNCATLQSNATHCKESTYGMIYDYTVPFHYEKRNHFIDCLRQRQAKEESNIPLNVYQTVRAELFRRNIFDPTSLRPKHIRKIMKARGLNSYYDHEIMIWSVVTGGQPPQFTEAQEKLLIRMFDDSIEPYMKHKGDRHNYLTYSFAIHKMLEILKWPRDIREFYPVLRSDSKRVDQEQIWHKMCIDLDWPIIKTEQQFIDDAKS